MTSDPHELFEGLPGGELVLEGLRDHRRGHPSIAACLVRMAAPRLMRAGVIDPIPEQNNDAELELYQLLSSSGDPRSYSRYNALIRELISFEHALDHRTSGAS